MSGPTPIRSERLQLLATPPHDCSYLPGRDAVTVFVDPAHPKDPWLYDLMSRNGFRRSGDHIYRPHCRDCRECVPVRVPVHEFRPRRAQRRTLRANRDLRVVPCDDTLREEHFDLYGRYLAARHPGGGMDDPTPSQYREFLTSAWAETVFYEFRLERRLVAVAVTDVLPNALSAVYTFFDPRDEVRSPGAYAILWQIEEARRLGLEWLYLGYWIEGSRKMRYKSEFTPQERFLDGEWVRASEPFAGPREFGQT